MDQLQRKNNYWMIITFVLIGVIIGFGISQLPYFKNTDTKASTIKADQAPQANQPSKPTAPEPQVANLTPEQTVKLLDDDPVKGDANAPVSIVEFSDFQCPFCSKFAQDTMASIEKDYVKTGKAKIVFRDFPLGEEMHPQAGTAALAAQCANEQGKFWEMHDMLFAKQKTDWSGNPQAANVFKDYAKQFGLDTKKFNACVDSQKYSNEIQKDVADGSSVGIQGTPGSFVNGKEVARYCWGMNRYTGQYEWMKLSGAMPYDIVFKPIIEAELAGKKWQLQFDETCNKVSVKIN